jgi:hypothetical protein
MDGFWIIWNFLRPQAGNDRPGVCEAWQPKMRQPNGEHHAQREHEAAKKTTAQRSRQLGPHIDKIVEAIVESGTVKADARPVVIIVREEMALPRPLQTWTMSTEKTTTKTMLTRRTTTEVASTIACSRRGATRRQLQNVTNIAKVNRALRV